MKNFINRIIFILYFIIIGLLIGQIFPHYKGVIFSNFNIFKLIFLIGSLFVVYELSIIAHEFGHLIFGTITGYKFVSIRWRNVLIKKDDKGKLKRYKYSVPQTAGQCLLLPPEKEPTPFFLYNAGGVLMNSFLAVGSYLILLQRISDGYISEVLFVFFFLNAFLVILNWGSIKGLTNDGENQRSLRRNPLSRKALKTILVLNAKLSEGELLSEMDIDVSDYREYSVDETLHRSVLTFYSTYLFNNHEYEKALEIMEYNLSANTKTVLDYALSTDYYLTLLLTNKEEAKQYLNDHQQDVNKGRILIGKTYAQYMFEIIEKYMEYGYVDSVQYNRFTSMLRTFPQPGLANDSKQVLDKIIHKDEVDFAFDKPMSSIDYSTF